MNMKDGKSMFEYSGKANNKINYILSQLKKHPDSNLFYVVGSIARGSIKPGDLDLVVDLRDTSFSNERLRDFRTLIDLANRRATGWDALFDPFVMFKNILVVRNDTATGWKKAIRAKELCAAFIAEMVPLNKVPDLPVLIIDA
jgi:predicted nucleotidyltransferase